MLHITPETRVYLRMVQNAANAREQRRQTIMVKPRRRQLNKDRFAQLVDRTKVILRTGQPTKFEYENACRYGLRVALIFAEWTWADADATAIEVVEASLKQLGMVRPSWPEAHGDILGHETERYFCARCGHKIGDERKSNGTPAKYCSKLCGEAARQAKARIIGERASLAAHLAACSVRSEQTLLERSGNCEHCRTPFLSARADRRFCSLKCAGAAKRAHAEKPCDVCSTLFRPRTNGDSKTGVSRFCSKECTAIGLTKVRPELKCETCSAIFRPRSPHQKRRYCSTACFRPWNSPARHFNVRCEEA